MSEVGVGAHSVYMDTMTIPIVRLVMSKNAQNLFFIFSEDTKGI